MPDGLRSNVDRHQWSLGRLTRYARRRKGTLLRPQTLRASTGGGWLSGEAENDVDGGSGGAQRGHGGV